MPAKATKQVFVPMPVEDDDQPIPQLNQLVSNPSERLKIKRKADRIQELKELMAPLEKEREKLKGELKDLVGQHQISKCMIDDLRLNYFGTARESLKKELLLENNVSPDIIKKSTVTTMSFTLRVDRVGGEDEG